MGKIAEHCPKCKHLVETFTEGDESCWFYRFVCSVCGLKWFRLSAPPEAPDKYLK